MSDNAEDLLLITRIKAGERELYSRLVSKYQHRVFGVLMRRTADRVLSEELTQQAFVKGYFGLPQFREEAQLSTWLIRIALNLLATERRRRPNVYSLEPREQVDPATPLSKHEKKQVFGRFRDCMNKLDMKYQSVLTLCALDENTYEDAAQVLQIPIGTVRSRMNRARFLLKECMGDLLSGGYHE